MANPDQKTTSHGQGGASEASPVPSHKSYGSDKRDEVGGGPAGRGNDTGTTTDTAGEWGRGDDQEGKGGPKPVAEEPGKPKNPFS